MVILHCLHQQTSPPTHTLEVTQIMWLTCLYYRHLQHTMWGWSYMLTSLNTHTKRDTSYVIDPVSTTDNCNTQCDGDSTCLRQTHTKSGRNYVIDLFLLPLSLLSQTPTHTHIIQIWCNLLLLRWNTKLQIFFSEIQWYPIKATFNTRFSETKE